MSEGSEPALSLSKGREVRNIRLTIDYLGRGFKGWQRQNKGRTIQGELEKALAVLLRDPVKVTGASRTDTGVNARGFAVNFKTESKITPDRLIRGLNGLLPEGIAATGAEDVSDEWHARKSAVYREYEYLIWNRIYPDIFRTEIAAHVSKPLNVEAMREAAADIAGEHDFKAFCVAASAHKGCVRRVETLVIDEPEAGLIRLTIRADGFVHKMVRSIVGTLMDVGLGKKETGVISEMLKTGDRGLAGRTAPPNGLTLTKIGYE
jgi:tRNA pseudouridine38-40 synthase